MAFKIFIFLYFYLFSVIYARSIPPNLQSFYEKVKSTPCTHPQAQGFEDGNGNTGFTYCTTSNLIYLTGPSQLSDMSIDCDGASNTAGKCADDPTGQGQTAFRDQVRQYGIPDLDASVHGYVVWGNTGDTPEFDPRSVGMRALSVMGVVCGRQLFYGIWGDTNAGLSTGEASISLATARFPDAGMTANAGHTGHDVLYVGFVGEEAVPGDRAMWNATSFEEFDGSLAGVGDKLVAGIGMGRHDGGTGGGSGNGNGGGQGHGHDGHGGTNGTQGNESGNGDDEDPSHDHSGGKTSTATCLKPTLSILLFLWTFI